MMMKKRRGERRKEKHYDDRKSFTFCFDVCFAIAISIIIIDEWKKNDGKYVSFIYTPYLKTHNREEEEEKKGGKNYEQKKCFDSSTNFSSLHKNYWRKTSIIRSSAMQCNTMAAPLTTTMRIDQNYFVVFYYSVVFPCLSVFLCKWTHITNERKKRATKQDANNNFCAFSVA